MRWIPPAVAGAFGLYQLGDPSFWIDEAYTAEYIDRSYRALVGELQWGHLTVAKAWAEIAGSSEVALRLPSVIAAVVAVVLMYGLARRMYGDRVALVASLLLAVNPFVVQWSQQARGYTMLLALSIGATWLFLRAREKGTFAAWASYGLALVVIVHWQPFAAALFIAAHVVVEWRNGRALAMWAAVTVFSVPWLDNVRDGSDLGLPTDWIPSPSFESVALTLRDLPGAYGVGIALAVIGAYLGRQHRGLLIAWAFLPFALALVISLHEPLFVGRYLTVSVPAFALLAAVALNELAGRLRVVAVAAAATGTAVGLVIWYAPDGSQNWRGEDWKAATEHVMRYGGGKVEPNWGLAGFLYYGGQVRDTGLVVQVQTPGVAFDERLALSFGHGLRVISLAPTRRSESTGEMTVDPLVTVETSRLPPESWKAMSST